MTLTFKLKLALENTVWLIVNVINFNFKLELCIDHVKFLDHFKNC